METGNNNFKGAIFGGFNRKDVLKFFEDFSKENNERIALLTNEIRRLEKENEQLITERASLNKDLEQLRGENSSMIETEEKMRAAQEQQSETLLEAEKKVELFSRKLAEAERNLADANNRLAVIQPQAHSYEMLKDRVATVELEAHQKAESIIEEANRKARMIRVETATWMNGIKDNYDALRERVRLHAQAVEKAEEDFITMNETYEDLIRRGLGEDT